MPTNDLSAWSTPEDLKGTQWDKQKSGGFAGQPIADFNPNQEKSKPIEKTKKYIGCKIICAEPMTQEAFLRSQNKWQENQETYGDGYKVIYPDGYLSWSPKKVFEEAYREITLPEFTLIMK